MRRARDVRNSLLDHYQKLFEEQAALSDLAEGTRLRVKTSQGEKGLQVSALFLA